ncbi:MAG: O-antigen ligase domain-containing protein [Xenococcaceae cyanobacterium MO_188.B32]|nr:O-antigen ligase domain-containing protein [Xenococcaceae cyanobacterium MO_188.B32]
MSNYPRQDSQSKSEKPAWMAIFGLSLLIGLCLLIGAGRILVPLFPFSSLVVGVFLYRRYPLFYNGFTWWLWFIGPLIRRMIDYKSGHLTYGPWTLTPLLVTSISFITLIKYLPKTYNSGGLPFLLSIGSLFYSFMIGLIQNPKNAAVNQFLAWLSPVLLAFHLFVNWRDYPSYRRNFQRIFLWGTLVMGLYGICQYLIAPEWDRFWLRSIDNLTFGRPEPLQIRVCSTMESPQSFANMMMAGLLLVFTNKGNQRFLGAGPGYLTFLLSRARSAWLGWMTGLMTFLLSLKSSLQIRLIITIMVGAFFVVPLTVMEPFSTVISSRIETLSNSPEDDFSYQQRAQGYSELLNVALSQFVGKGLGYHIESDSIGSNDSSILSILFSLGWVGGIPYLGGLFMLLLRLMQGPERRFDPFASCAFAIVLGIFVQLGLNMIFNSSLGMVIWGFIGIGMAANKYYFYQRNVARKQS